MILPGRPAREGDIDPRWQAIIAVGEFIESEPEIVCDFAMRWARRPGADLQRAIACCLLEHLLECHFDLVFPRMCAAALLNARVAEHFTHWRWPFGQATRPRNVARLKRFASELRRRREQGERPFLPSTVRKCDRSTKRQRK
jgi:hypothetical protein